MNEPHHFFQRGAGEKNFVHAFATHYCRIVVRDRAAAAPEDFDVGRAFLAEKIDNFGEKLDVSAVVTGNADRTHVLLDCSTDNVADRAMVSQINDFDPVPDELEID